RQLGAVYSKAGNSAKSAEMLMIFMSKKSGTKNADPAGAAKAAPAASDGAKTLAANGAPEEVWDWESDGRKLQTWAYFAKKLGFTFDKAGYKLVQKSDWSSTASVAEKK